MTGQGHPEKSTIRVTASTIGGTEAPLPAALAPNAGDYVLMTLAPYARRVFDAAGSKAQPYRLVRSEGEPPTGNSKVDSAYDNTGIAFDYFRSLGYDAVKELDGQYMDNVVNAPFKNDAHPSEPGEIEGGSGMVYGIGDGIIIGEMERGVDVAIHELAHVISSDRVGFFDNDVVETRAVNESYSDVFGELGEAWHRTRVSGARVAPDWKVGMDVFTPAIPGDGMRAGDDPKRAHEGSDLPSHMKEFSESGGADPYMTNPGPWNSTIGTHAAFRATNSIGPDKVARIWLQSLDHIDRTARFADVAQATVKAARELYSPYEAAAVRDAWHAVGLSTN